jgi:hypothetical protein
MRYRSETRDRHGGLIMEHNDQPTNRGATIFACSSRRAPRNFSAQVPVILRGQFLLLLT